MGATSGEGEERDVGMRDECSTSDGTTTKDDVDDAWWQLRLLQHAAEHARRETRHLARFGDDAVASWAWVGGAWVCEYDLQWPARSSR